MHPHRISVKFFITDPTSVELETFLPIFHRWIQENKSKDLLIDVADYKHVRHGPGIVLVGHNGDYNLDMANGHPGLRYTRKRSAGSTLGESLGAALRGALDGISLLAAEPSLAGRVTFRTDGAEILILDRLRTPNTQTGRTQAQTGVETVLAQSYPDSTFIVTAVGEDERRPVQLRVQVQSGPVLTTPEFMRQRV